MHTALCRAKGRVPKLEDMDVSLIEFGPPENRAHNRCSKITYDGQLCPWRRNFRQCRQLSVSHSVTTRRITRVRRRSGVCI